MAATGPDWTPHPCCSHMGASGENANTEGTSDSGCKYHKKWLRLSRTGEKEMQNLHENVSHTSYWYFSPEPGEEEEEGDEISPRWLRGLQRQLCRPVLRTLWRDFPGGPVVKNPPSNAGSIPRQGTEIPLVS